MQVEPSKSYHVLSVINSGRRQCSKELKPRAKYFSGNLQDVPQPLPLGSKWPYLNTANNKYVKYACSRMTYGSILGWYKPVKDP